MATSAIRKLFNKSTHNACLISFIFSIKKTLIIIAKGIDGIFQESAQYNHEGQTDMHCIVQP
jgi:hypothetical protein